MHVVLMCMLPQRTARPQQAESENLALMCCRSDTFSEHVVDIVGNRLSRLLLAPNKIFFSTLVLFRDVVYLQAKVSSTSQPENALQGARDAGWLVRHFLQGACLGQDRLFQV